MIILNSIKCSSLDVAAVLDPPLVLRLALAMNRLHFLLRLNVQMKSRILQVVIWKELIQVKGFVFSTLLLLVACFFLFE